MIREGRMMGTFKVSTLVQTDLVSVQAEGVLGAEAEAQAEREEKVRPAAVGRHCSGEGTDAQDQRHMGRQ